MSAEAQGRAKAERFRQEHHLGVQPLGDLVAIIEQATGIDVAVLEVGPDEHGMMMRDSERDAVFIGVARTRHPMRQRSTLAHELGHVLFEDWNQSPEGGWSEHPWEETRATAFARHLLLPLQGLEEFLQGREPTSLSTLSAVVQRFVVSPAIAAIALHQLGLIDAATKQQWMAQTSAPQLAAQFGWSDHYHALQQDSDRRRAPQRLVARATAAYAQGMLSAQAIATVRGTTVDEVETELHQAGIVPTTPPVQWASSTDLPEVNVDLGALDADLDSPDEDSDESDHKVSEDR